MGTKMTLGQFLPGDSCIHRLDPRTKIVLMIAYIVLVFLVKSMPVFLLPALFVIVTVYLARVPISYLLSSIRPIRWLLVFMFLINVFFTQGETVLFSWWVIRITEEALRQALFMPLRLLLLVAGTSLLTLTTSPIALTDLV